jgi:Flp pilus assembly protein TadB
LSFEEVESDNQAGVAATAIGTIVTAIINLFKQAKQRREEAKKAGISEAEYKKQTTEEEARLGEAGEKVEKELEVKALEDGEVKKVDVKKFIIYAVIIGAVILVIYFLNKKK